MKRLASRILLLAAAFLLLPLAAQAQAFRAYLASYGSDTNAGCTVSAPCRLLPAALNAVLDGGEVWILDSANFNSGTVNINKSVSIIAIPGEIGSIVAVAASPAITISTSVQVLLRNIAIAKNANNPGTFGIVMTNGHLVVDGCVFANLASGGIYVHDTQSNVSVSNSVFKNNANYSVWAQNGPRVTITNSQFLNNAEGVLALGTTASTTQVAVSDTTITGSDEGVYALTEIAGATVKISVTRSTITNSNFALDAETSGAGTSLITVVASTASLNTYGIYQSGAGSAVKSLGNNFIADNGSDYGVLTTTPLR